MYKDTRRLTVKAALPNCKVLKWKVQNETEAKFFPAIYSVFDMSTKGVSQATYTHRSVTKTGHTFLMPVN